LNGNEPGVQADIRTAVLVYDDSTDAGAGFRSIRLESYERCLAATINRWHEIRPRYRGDDATPESFDSTSRPVAADFDARLIETQFDEALLGGGDNSRAQALFVGRKGPVVVTALVVANTQGFRADELASLSNAANRVGEEMLRRRSAAK